RWPAATRGGTAAACGGPPDPGDKRVAWSRRGLCPAISRGRRNAPIMIEEGPYVALPPRRCGIRGGPGLGRIHWKQTRPAITTWIKDKPGHAERQVTPTPPAPPPFLPPPQP